MKGSHCCCGTERVSGSISPRALEKKADAKHIMLAGNPNCGKSTLFNRLCNLHVRTGNYPGVTVSRHVGSYGHDIQIIDLPGTYSLSSSSAEERIAVSELLDNDAELIVNVIDATCLERSLYLTLELKMLGVPMIVALNMCDVARKQGIIIDTKKLSEFLGTEVVSVSAASGEGLDVLEAKLKSTTWRPVEPVYLGSEAILKELEKAVQVTPNLYKPHALFYAKSAVLGDLYPSGLDEVAEWREAVAEAEKNITAGKDSVYHAMADDRYDYIGRIISACVSYKEKGATSGTDKLTTLIDRLVLNRIWAFPIFLLIMCCVYYISVTWLGAIATDYANDTLFGEQIIPAVSEFVTNHGGADWLASLIGDGIVGGVGAVLGFVPQMIILFFLLSILEECGYMTRATFILDRIFNMFGLSGRAFIPFLIGSGCGVPGLMTVRTLGSEGERRITLFTTTMIPCGAKLPIIIVFAGAVFGDIPFFAPAMYVMGVIVVILSAFILKKFSDFKQSAAPLMLELPSYHVPMLRVVLLSVWHRTKGYIMKAGVIIMPCVTALWLLSHVGYDAENSKFSMLSDEEAGESLIADVGKPLSNIFAPLGFNDYRATVAAFTGILAKESVVSTMAVFSGTEEPEEPEEDATDEENAEFEEATNSFYTAIRNNMFHIDERGVTGILAALSFVIFNLFTVPCVAAIGVLRKELGNGRLFCMAIAYQLLISYCLALSFFQFGLLFCGQGFTAWTAVAIVFWIVVAYIVFLKKGPQVEQKIDFEMAD